MSLLSFRSSQKTLSSLHKLRAPAVRQTRLASSNSKSASPPADQHNVSPSWQHTHLQLLTMLESERGSRTSTLWATEEA